MSRFLTFAVLLALVAVPAAASKAKPKAHRAHPAAETARHSRALSDGNLLANGSFDSSLAGWSGYNATLSLASDGHVGPGAALVRATAAGTVSIYPSPRPVRSSIAGASYAASTWVEGKAGKTLCLQVREWASSATGSAEACVVASGTWQQLGPVAYTTKAGGDSLEAYVYERSAVKGDTFEVDGIELAPGGSVSTSPPTPAPAPTPAPTPAPVPAPAAADAFYVSPSGSDSAAGTLAAPWATLQHALDTLSAGQTVYLRGGSYGAWTTESRSGAAGAPITVTAYPGESPTITGRLKIAGSWVTVSHLHFLGSTSANTNGVLIYLSGGDHVTIADNELDHANMSAIYVGDPGNGADYATIVGNDIHDNGTHVNHDHGIYFGTGAFGLIAGNEIARNYARGIQCYPDCDNTVIANNTVVGNQRAGIQIGDEAGESSDADLVVNNIVASNGDIGIRSYWGGAPGVGDTVQDNLVWGNAGGDLAGPGLTFVGNTVANPLFVGPTDFHLTAGSPAVDAALAAYAPPLDLDGRARSGAPDLGAYELR